MIRLSVLALLALVLAACGSQTADSGSPASPTTSTSTSISGSDEPQVVGLYSATAAGGRAAGPVVDVSDQAGQDQLLGTVRGQLRDDVLAAIAATEVPDGQRLVGGIVTVDCASPAAAELVDSGQGMTFAPVWETKPPPECFAAVTTIGLALVPEDWATSVG